MTEVEFETDEKEQEDEAELADRHEDQSQQVIGKFGRQIGQAGMKERAEAARPDLTEQRGTEDQARDDLANDARLSETFGDASEQTGNEDEDEELEQHR